MWSFIHLMLPLNNAQVSQRHAFIRPYDCFPLAEKFTKKYQQSYRYLQYVPYLNRMIQSKIYIYILYTISDYLSQFKTDWRLFYDPNLGTKKARVINCGLTLSKMTQFTSECTFDIHPIMFSSKRIWLIKWLIVNTFPGIVNRRVASHVTRNTMAFLPVNLQLMSHGTRLSWCGACVCNTAVTIENNERNINQFV